MLLRGGEVHLVVVCKNHVPPQCGHFLEKHHGPGVPIEQAWPSRSEYRTMHPYLEHKNYSRRPLIGWMRNEAAAQRVS